MAHSNVATVALNMVDGRSEARSRDEAHELFLTHAASLYRLALVIVRNRDDAEDAVQDAFVRLVEHLARDGNRSNLRAWLFAVTVNACRDRLRRNRRWLPWLPEHEQALTTAPQLDNRSPDQIFLGTLALLRPRDRLLLALRAQGLSYREIASAAGLRDTSVGRLLARAMERWTRARDTLSIS